jgi:hypothetical protein
VVPNPEGGGDYVRPRLFTDSGDPSAPGPILRGVLRHSGHMGFFRPGISLVTVPSNVGLNNLSEQDLMVDPPPG